MSGFLVCGSVLAPVNAIPVRAAQYVASLKGAVELGSLLYGLLEAAFVAAGVAGGIYAAENGEDLFDTFCDFALTDPDSNAMLQNSVFVMSDNTYVTWAEAADVIAGYKDSVEDFSTQVVDAYSQAVAAGEEAASQFSECVYVKAAADMMDTFGDFVSMVWNGEVEAVAPETVFIEQENALAGYYWDGEYEYNEAGKLVVKGFGDYTSDISPYTHYDFVYDTTAYYSYPLAIYLKASSSSFYYYFPDDDAIYKSPSIAYTSTYYDGTTLKEVEKGSSNYAGRTTGTNYMNIPMFTDYDALCAFLKTGATAGITNALLYSCDTLIDSAASTLSPYADVYIPAGSVAGVNTAVMDALQEEVATNTGTYEDTDAATLALEGVISAALVAALAGVAVTDIPITDAGVKEETDTDTETDEETDDTAGVVVPDAGSMEYTVGLTSLFPFCIPFDFIALLQVLDADAEAPCFEIPFVVPALNIDMTVQLDMSFLDPVMEIWRLGELGCFILLLISATSKVIRW